MWYWHNYACLTIPRFRLRYTSRSNQCTHNDFYWRCYEIRNLLTDSINAYTRAHAHKWPTLWTDEGRCTPIMVPSSSYLICPRTWATTTKQSRWFEWPARIVGILFPPSNPSDHPLIHTWNILSPTVRNEQRENLEHRKGERDTVTVHCTPVDHRRYHTHRTVLAWFVVTHTQLRRPRAQIYIQLYKANIIIIVVMSCGGNVQSMKCRQVRSLNCKRA